MSIAIYNSGDKYGYLTLTGKCYMGDCGGQKRRYLECICQCGTIFFTLYQSLKSGAVQSCGCKKRQHLITLNTKHGLPKDSTYWTWVSIKSRCYNSKTKYYENYGGRGIKVCDRWLESYSNFLEDMGKKPSPELTLERRDTDDNYCPENCGWDTRFVQNRNKRTNRFIIAFGETKCLTDWSKDDRCKVSYAAFFNRVVNLKVDPETALLTPAHSRHKF